MKAWSEALLDAYLKAGGVWPPRPYEAPVKKVLSDQEYWRKLGIDFARIFILTGAPIRIAQQRHVKAHFRGPDLRRGRLRPLSQRTNDGGLGQLLPRLRIFLRLIRRIDD
jgi:hypothetical protein